VRHGGYLGLAGVVCIGAFLFAHRALLHEIVIDTVLALVSLAGLCLLAAGAKVLAGRRAQPAPVRERVTVVRPAARRAPRPAGTCACGRPAVTPIAGRPSCAVCAAGWVAGQERPDADFTATVTPAGRVEVAEVRVWNYDPAGEPYQDDTRDMTDFEKRLLP
jgi:hypothetical protein